jgi:inhibitor of KinA sporulation pathway (predicted exonuclease)
VRVLALDLEMAQPSNKIIQIGAIAGDLSTGEVIDSFNRYIKIDEELSEFIVKLTGITNAMLDSEGVPLTQAYLDLVDFARRNNTYLNPIVWGGGDTVALREQVKAETPSAPWSFGRRWIDAKTVYISYCLANAKKPYGGLAKSMTKLGINFKGTKHTALDDATNTFIIYCKLLELIKKGE